MGLNPVGPPARSGHFYIQRVADYYGRPLRVIVDATRGQVVSVEPLGAPGSITGGPYAANGPYAGPGGPYGRRPYPPYGMSPDEDEFDGPPARRAALGQPQMEPYHPGTPMQPPRAAVKPAAKSAAITPGRTPVPRKRPVAAPQETAGTIEPLAKPAEAPQVKPAEPMPEPAATPAIPPVAPLE